MIQNAVIRLFTVLGEASRLLSEEMKAQAGQIPWAQIAGMRNRIVHAYWQVDTQILWDAIQRDIPELIIGLKHILGSLSEDQSSDI